MLREKIEHHPDTGGQVAALADIDRVEGFADPGTRVVEHLDQPAGGDVLAHGEGGEPRQSRAADRQMT